MQPLDVLLTAGTAVAAGGTALLIAMAVRRRRAAANAARTAGQSEPDIPLEFEVVKDVPVTIMDPAPAPVSFAPVAEPQLQAVAVGARGASNPMPLPPILREDHRAAPPPPAPIPTEWARRQVGPAGPGRTKGACSGCGAMLSVSNQRPLRIACPVCGRTRLLA